MDLPHSGPSYPFKPSHPFKPRECIEMEGVDRMLLASGTTPGRSAQRRSVCPVTAPSRFSSSARQKARWRDWHPDKQIIMFGTRLLTNPNVVLEDAESTTAAS